MNFPRPPAHIAPYVTALGPDVAVRFFLEFGGADLYIAANPTGQSHLVAVLGLDGALALAAIRHQLQSRVPTAKPWIAQYLSQVDGLSKAAIARKLHASVPSVTRWLDRDQPRRWTDPRQYSML